MTHRRWRTLVSISLALALLLVLWPASAPKTAAEDPRPAVELRGPAQGTDGANGSGLVAEQALQNVDLVGKLSLGTWAVAISGNTAYIGTGTRLSTVDVVTPTLPVLKGQTAGMPGIVQDVVVAGNYAYVADGLGGLRIVDVSNQTQPKEVGSFATQDYALGVAVAGSYAYLAVAGRGLMILDVSNVSSPGLVGAFDTAGYAYDVAVAGSFAYVADWNKGLRVINVADPSTPQEVGACGLPGFALGVAVDGSFAYVADGQTGFAVCDVSNPAAPVAAYVNPSNQSGYAYGVALSGKYAYVAAWSSGLRVFDISTPAHPTEVGFFDTAGYSWSVAAAGNTAYVADGEGGFLVLRYGSGQNPPPNPTVPVPFFVASPISGTVPLTVTFTNQSTGTYTDCQWDYGDGTPKAPCASTQHVFNTVGTFTVTLTLTATDVTPSPRFSSVVTVTNPPGTWELIRNGGFESGAFSPWASGTFGPPLSPRPTVSQDHPRSGTFDARLGFQNRQVSDFVYQTVTIPVTATSAVLSFWYWPYSEDIGPVATDWQAAWIRDANGRFLGQVMTIRENSRTWRLRTADLMAYKGRTIQIYFETRNNLIRATGMYLDDVSLVITHP